MCWARIEPAAVQRHRHASTGLSLQLPSILAGYRPENQRPSHRLGQT